MVRPKLTQPTDDDHRELQSLIINDSDEVMLRKKKIKIKWLHGGTRLKLTKLMNATKTEEEDADPTLLCKAAALMTLNSPFKIFLWYRLKWRWMYYIKQYSEEELIPLFALCKKKVPQEQYLIATTFLTALKDTNMTMKKTEVNRFLREQSGVNSTTSAKNTPGSASQDTSSSDS